MKQTPGTMRQVIAPKAAAVENFERSTGAAPMAFSLLCSSVSAVAGYSGQVHGVEDWIVKLNFGVFSPEALAWPQVEARSGPVTGQKCLCSRPYKMYLLSSPFFCK